MAATSVRERTRVRSTAKLTRVSSIEEIWAALRAAVESDTETARAIIDSAGIIVSGRDLSTCWDSRGALYSLPKYVLSAPTNLVKE